MFHSVSFQAQAHHFIWVKYAPFILDPFLRGILSQQLKNDFEISSAGYAVKFKSSLDYNLHIRT